MTAISSRQPEVMVEYDAKGKRVTKTFEDAHKAKRFYVIQNKLGRNPKVVGGKVKPTEVVACYVRVSTVDQNEASQVTEIKRWLTGNGVEASGVKWFTDKKSADNLERPGFEALQTAIFNGEVGSVVIYKLDRLSRKLREGIDVLCDWCDHGLRVVSVTQQIDFNGTIGKMIASVLLGVAEMEQETRRERQRAGIEVAKKQGKYKNCGRKVGTTKAKPERARKLRDKGLTAPEIANALGVTRNTVFRYLRSDSI